MQVNPRLSLKLNKLNPAGAAPTMSLARFRVFVLDELGAIPYCLKSASCDNDSNTPQDNLANQGNDSATGAGAWIGGRGVFSASGSM